MFNFLASVDIVLYTRHERDISFFGFCGHYPQHGCI